VEIFHTLRTFAHALACRRLFQRFNFAPDGVDLAWQKVFAVGVLGKFAAHNLGEVNHRHRDHFPAECLTGLQPPFARDQLAARREHNRMQKPDFPNAAGQGVNVAQLAPVATAHDN
jgi:hypothetical protein